MKNDMDEIQCLTKGVGDINANDFRGNEKDN